MAYAAVTRATLRTRLQDRYDGTPFWSATEANDAINEALRYFNLYTGYWRGAATVVTGAADRFLTVSGTLTAGTRVFRSGQVLTRKSIVEFYRQRRNWRTQTTASGSGVPTVISEWAPIGLSTIAIWPADAAGGTTITIDAVKITPILSADGTNVDLGTEELDLILDEALYILNFKRPSDLEAVKPGHLRFLAGCMERNALLKGSSFFKEALGLPQEVALKPPFIRSEGVAGGGD